MKYQVGNVIEVTVTSIEPYGAFVAANENYKGLIHISEINGKYIKCINDYLNVGDKIYARILDVDKKNKKIKLTLKNLNYKLSSTENDLEDTNLGFSLLADLLPFWINEKLDSMEKYK